MSRKPYADYRNFKGENTLSDPLALKASELQSAMDIDIDIDKSAHRKKNGNTLLLAGVYRNVWSNGQIFLCTQNGNLYYINDDLATLTLLRADVGDNDMSYVDVAGTGIVYYSNLAVIGYIKDFRSYVMGPTAVRDRVDTFPMYPLEYFGNRLWGFVGDVLWRTDPDQLFYFNRIDPEQGFIQRKGPGTLLKAVRDGLYIADGSHYFIRNAGRKADNFEFICDYNAIPGAVTQNLVDVEMISEDGSLTTGKAHFWMTEKGLRYGMDGGISINLTRKRLKMPLVYRGAILHRDNDEAFNQLITSLWT